MARKAHVCAYRAQGGGGGGKESFGENIGSGTVQVFKQMRQDGETAFMQFRSIDATTIFSVSQTSGTITIGLNTDIIDVDEKSEAFVKKITKGSVLMSITYQKINGNMSYQSTVKVVNSDQAYKVLLERKDAGDERILLRVWRPEYRVSSLVALSFNNKKSD